MIVQLAPAASVAPQFPAGVSEKSLALVLAPGVIVGVIPVSVALALVFFRVTGCGVPGMAVSGFESS